MISFKNKAKIDIIILGFTGFSVGHVNNKLVYLPIREMINGIYDNKIKNFKRE